MKEHGKELCLAIGVLVLVALFSGIAFSSEKTATAENALITGTITQDNQIIDKDGQTYGLADTDKANELSAFVGTKVQIKGTVLEKEGKKMITISEYELLKE